MPNTHNNLFIPQNTGNFHLLDSGNGRRLEKWDDILLDRPDPQAIWKKALPKKDWLAAHAVFEKTWSKKRELPEKWEYNFQTLDHKIQIRLQCELTPFKHTGVFPEQSYNWQALYEIWKAHKKPWKVLNLFAYTGGTTCLLASLGCQVTHVDASKPSISWAKENHRLNGLPENSVRWILDDAKKFVEREIKRGSKYDCILLDPPAFGHSPTGKTWKFAEDLPELLKSCTELLSENAACLLVNAYATNTSSIALGNLMEDTMEQSGQLISGELCLSQKNSRLLSTGITTIWTAKETAFKVL